MKEEYEKNRYKKWVVTLFGIIIGLIFGISIPKIYNFMTTTTTIIIIDIIIILYLYFDINNL
jgi:hypothetical protein